MEQELQSSSLAKIGSKGKMPMSWKKCNSSCYQDPFDNQTNQCISEQYGKHENRLDEDMLRVSDVNDHD